MAKQEVKVGQKVKNKCPVCGEAEIESFSYQIATLNQLRNTKRIIIECWECNTEFWFYLRTGELTVKRIKDYVA